MSQPPGTYPLVFESGVVSFDADGALHVWLSHGPQAPHPVQTHPEGVDGHVPAEVTQAVLQGETRDGSVHLGMMEAPERPQGLELVIRGYRSIRLEASGDLTVVVEGVQDPPSWFTPGKVHRFAGPDPAPRLWSGSAPVPVRKASPRPPPPPPRPSAAAPAPTGAKGSGCAVLLAVVALGGTLAALV
ncbi:hypothetical protein L6R53_14545 [Myxococcota bacterium]|nr:hypothetical protein [Myxococcota bacterium]